MIHLGKHQIRLLASLGTPSMMLVVPSSVSRSLEKRGLLASRSKKCDGFIGITAAGLRALADLYDAGKLAQLYDAEKIAENARGPGVGE